MKFRAFGLFKGLELLMSALSRAWRSASPCVAASYRGINAGQQYYTSSVMLSFTVPCSLFSNDGLPRYGHDAQLRMNRGVVRRERAHETVLVPGCVGPRVPGAVMGAAIGHQLRETLGARRGGRRRQVAGDHASGTHRNASPLWQFPHAEEGNSASSASEICGLAILPLLVSASSISRLRRARQVIAGSR